MIIRHLVTAGIISRTVYNSYYTPPSYQQRSGIGRQTLKWGLFVLQAASHVCIVNFYVKHFQMNVIQ